MRCTAHVTATSVALRSRNSPTDTQCQRQAVRNGLCAQHAGCQVATCDLAAVTQEGRWWFCRTHARLYRTHNLIVERIMSIPPRP